MQSKKKQENDILIEVKKIGQQLKEFQTSTDGKFGKIDQRFDQVDISIGELAIATAHEFQEVREEMGKMATKTEQHELRVEVMQAIDNVDAHLSATASQWRDDFEEVMDLLKEHDGRLRVLEKLHRAV